MNENIHRSATVITSWDMYKDMLYYLNANKNDYCWIIAAHTTAEPGACNNKIHGNHHHFIIWWHTNRNFHKTPVRSFL